MEKNKVIDGLIKDLRAKKEEAKKLHNAGKTVEYQAALEDIKKTEKSLQDMLEITDIIDKNPEKKENSFINILKADLGLVKASDTDRLIMNYMKEGDGSDGGFTVPDDIVTDVKALRNNDTSLELLVNVEPVIRSEGRRTIELRAAVEPLEEVEEDGEIPVIEADRMVEVKYKIKKRAGIIKVSRELMADANKVILKWLKTWLAKKTRATRNHAIVTRINAMTEGKEVAITAAKGLKSIFNKTLDAYSNTAIVLTNGSGYEYLDNMLDEAGKPVLESDLPNRRKLLFGLYPVVKVSDTLLSNTEVLNLDGVTVDAYRYPIICGDLKEAITLFDREKLSIEISNRGNTFFVDLTSIKVRDRIDVQAVDEDAVIKAYVEVTA